MVTTQYIEFERPLQLDRSKFRDAEDFLMALYRFRGQENNDYEDLDFHELDESEVTNDLKILIKKSLQTPKHLLHNL